MPSRSPTPQPSARSSAPLWGSGCILSLGSTSLFLHPFFKIQLMFHLLWKAFISTPGHAVLFRLWSFITSQYHSFWHFIIYHFAFLIRRMKKEGNLSCYTLSRIAQVFLLSTFYFGNSCTNEKFYELYDQNLYLLHLESAIVNMLPRFISLSLSLIFSCSCLCLWV